MRPAHFSYTFLSCFVSCIFLLRWKQNIVFSINLWQALLLLALLGVLALTGKSTRRIGLTILAITLGISTAAATVVRTIHIPTSLSIDTYADGQTVEIRGEVAAEPDRRPMQIKYTVEAEEIRLQSGTIIFPVRGKVLATDMSGWPEYSYGDAILIRGILEKPGKIETFRYDQYLSRFSIYTTMYRASIEKIPLSNTRSIKPLPQMKRMLFSAKRSFESQINRLYAEPHASFMAGLLTGSRRGIPKHLLDDFNATGLTHIIAISGYNITIVIAVISGMLFWLPLKIRFFPATVSIIVFALFVGASAAVVRASIMGILGLLALQTGRQSRTRLTILWTLFCMLIWNPKYLWYDAGFQLSFLAVLGLVEIGPLLNPLVRYIPRALGIREAVQMTIAAQISAVPLVLLLFGRISLVAPIANVLVAPLIPLAMLFGFSGAVMSFFWFPLGQLIGYIGWGCLEWITLVAHAMANVPFASIELGGMRSLTIALYYLGMGLFLLRPHKSITDAHKHYSDTPHHS